MALNKNTLKQNLIDHFTTIRDDTEGKFTQKDSADGFAKAIVDYAKDAEVIIAGSPPFIPAAPSPLPDASVMGQKAKVQGASAGQTALAGLILASFSAMDPSMSSVTAGIGTYAVTFVSYKTIPGAMLTGATVMAAPPIFAPAIAKGMNGGSIKDVSSAMATAIHLSFKASMFSGIIINSTTGAVIPGAVAGPLQ
jgi:hypothetical protein